MQKFKPYLIFFASDPSYLALAITQNVSSAVASAYVTGKNQGGLQENIKVHSLMGRLIMTDDVNSSDAIDEGRFWDVVSYYPDHPLFWSFLSGKASFFGFSTTQDFIHEMAAWKVHDPEGFQCFLDEYDTLPEHYGHVQVLEEIIAKSERLELLVAKGTSSAWAN